MSGENIFSSGTEAATKPMTRNHKLSLGRSLSSLQDDLSGDDLYIITQFLHQEGFLEEDEKLRLEHLVDVDYQKGFQELLQMLQIKSDCAFTKLQEFFSISNEETLRNLAKLLQDCCASYDQESKDEFDTFRVRNMPPYYVHREEDVKAVEQLLEQEEDKEKQEIQTAKIVGLWGMGGSGKTVVALKVCNSMKYNLRVIWLTVGRDPNIVQLFNQIHQDLTGSEGKFSDSENAADWLKKHSESNFPFLLVLDDVWHFDHAAPLATCMARKCKILMTTRDKNIIRCLYGSVHELKCLDDVASHELLFSCAKVKKDKFENHQDLVQNILEFLGGLPLAIVLIGSSLNRNEFALSDWEHIYQRLKYAKETFLESNTNIPDVVYGYKNIYHAFEVSFGVLSLHAPASSHVEISLEERCLHLALLPVDTEISLEVLFKIWESQMSNPANIGSHKLSIEHYDQFHVLADKSFLTISIRNDKYYCAVHDLLLEFIKYKLCKQDPKRLKKCHEKLVDYYAENVPKDVDNLPEWWTKEDDGYIYKYLGHHLIEAGKEAEFKRLLWNIEWLDRKLLLTDITAVLQDFMILKNCTRFITEDDLQKSFLLQESLLLSRHILSTFKDQMCSQLMGRLGLHKSVEVTRFLEGIRKYIDNKPPMLLSDEHYFTSPGGYRIQSFRHFSAVTCASFSKDNKYLYTGSGDHQLRRFELKTGHVKIMGTGDERHTGTVTCMVVEEQVGYIVTGSLDSTLCLWPLKGSSTFYFRRFCGHSSGVLTVSTNPKRGIIVSGSVDQSIRVWSLRSPPCSNPCVATISPAHIHGVREVAAADRDGKCIIVSVGGETDGLIKMWDYELDIRQPQQSWEGHKGGVNTVCVSSDNQTIVTGGRQDCFVKVWNFSGDLCATCTGHVLDLLKCFITADCQFILSGGHDKTARLWNLKEGTLERAFRGHGQAVRALCVSDDNKLAVTGGQGQMAILWKSNPRDGIRPADNEKMMHDLDVTAVATSPQGNRIISASRDKTVKVWEWPSMELLETLARHSDKVNVVVVSSNPKYELVALSGSEDRNICVWDLTSLNKEPVHVFKDSHRFGITALCTYNDGQFMFSGSYGNFIVAHDMEQFSVLFKLDCHQHSNVRHLKVECSKLMAAFDGAVVSWDLEVKSSHENNLTCVMSTTQVMTSKVPYCCSPAKEVGGFVSNLTDFNKIRLLYVAQDIEGRLYSPHRTPGDVVTAVYAGSTDSIIWTGSLHGYVACINGRVQPSKSVELSFCTGSMVKAIKVSPSGRYFVAGCADGVVWAWTVSSDLLSSSPHKKLLTLNGSVESIDLCEINDKCLVAVSSAEAEVEVWDIKGTSRIFSLKEQTGKVTSVLYLCGGERLLTCSMDRSVCFWNLVTGNLERVDAIRWLKYGALCLALGSYRSSAVYAVGGFENVIEIRDVESGKIIKTLCTNDLFHLKSMFFTDAGTIMCAFGREYYAEISIETGESKCIAYNMQREFGPVSHIVNSKIILTYATHCNADLWDVSTGESLCTLDGGLKRAILSACTMSCGFVAIGSYDKILQIWDISNTHQPRRIASFAFDHSVLSICEFKPKQLMVGLTNGQLCALQLTN